ncbi:hypothetical protein F4780DRAFT_724628 [Xylariomycetidae sp. FL0641]|nr:hypothetical protein F4780DRAFT_724628 [Xylariomycetidae sp. FL0641]
MSACAPAQPRLAAHGSLVSAGSWLGLAGIISIPGLCQGPHNAPVFTVQYQNRPLGPLREHTRSRSLACPTYLVLSTRYLPLLVLLTSHPEHCTAVGRASRRHSASGACPMLRPHKPSAQCIDLCCVGKVPCPSPVEGLNKDLHVCQTRRYSINRALGDDYQDCRDR